ncbi:Leucyltransferase [Ruegeria sp. TM1040]|uniref:Leucyl/phenylalanyl-tRNA--protein transferase n=1 Tax=Ruegeria sp. (strain TM1040) TaxID=292414 RepID=LFTR_RUEST|nr:leucyl/phenylalanyl-tRNA--protein transferase [Ruegeria sp. TM1040]Q1GGG4.1 RecName: Full=Leucyl/phenylalanyl-tRNA--protein transferase; AltName: Full=L/F-transferase; AltName: Full=Leucyltransferase; AltName: Full=Phenyalanyltransferase [Ruegeria sp. TM1040]ABF64252.1 Leucyltransferase [Ruegeria sp. TM1040]
MTLSADLLLHAYANGVFPMAESRDDPEVFWVDPKRRGILPLDGFRISRSLAKRLRRDDYSISVNRDFAGVVQGCADREETWINGEIFDRYQELHHDGFAHSLEVWMDDALVGGVYGVSLGGAFFGESMFSRRRDASKIALAYLVDRLNAGGYILCDTQFITPHLASLGGREISRAAYRRRLAEALDQPGDFISPALPSPQVLLQRRTQTS